MLGYLHNSPPFEVDATTQLFEESLNDPRPRTESLRFKALPPSALQPQPASSAMNSFAFSHPSSSRLSSLLVDTTDLHAAPLSPPSSSFALPLIEASPSVPQTKSKPASKKNRRSTSDDEPKKKTSNKKRKTQQSSSDDDDDDEASVVNIDVIPKNREAKKARRRLKNRLAAQNSRERKKAYVQTLEEQVAQLQKQNEALQAQLRLILDERSDLQHKASSRSRKRSHMSSSVSSSILSPVSPSDLDDVAMSSSSSMSSPRSPTITTEALLTVPVSVPTPHPHPVSSNVKLEFHQGVSSQEDASAVSAAAFHFSGDSAVVVTSSLPSMNPRVVSRSCLNSSTRSSLKTSPMQIQVRPISSSPSHLTSPLSQKSPSPSEQLTLVLWVVAVLQLVQRLSLNIPLQAQAQASKTPLGSTRPSPSLTRKKTPWSPYPSPSPSPCRQHRTWQALSMSRAQKLDLVRARATATSSWTTSQQTESLSPPSLSNSPDPMVAPAAVLALDSMASAMALCQRVVSLYVCSSVLVYCLSEQRRRLKQV